MRCSEVVLPIASCSATLVMCASITACFVPGARLKGASGHIYCSCVVQATSAQPWQGWQQGQQAQEVGANLDSYIDSK